MDQCGQMYCDFWNNAEHTCALALEVHERVELLQHINRILEKLEKAGKDEISVKVIGDVAKMNVLLH